MTETEIARRLGYSAVYVRSLLDLIAAPKQVRDMVSRGEVSATTARKAIKKHGGKAAEVLQEAVTTAQAKGKTRATEKHLQKADASKSSARWQSAVPDILAERRRQVDEEGWTADHDDEIHAGELAAAAASYALNAADQLHPLSRGAGGNEQPAIWPWASDWWKPTAPRRDLIKAAALLIAQIESLDRIAAHRQSQETTEE
jgi:hypothetical protein